MRIPITMIHGLDPNFETWMGTAAEMGFQSVSYDDLAAWRFGEGAPLPAPPIMIDFDHPARSIRYGCFEVLSRHRFRGNLFVNTGHLDDLYSKPIPPPAERETMTWEEIGELLAADGGPPYAARYITERSDPYRLPSMELQRLLAEPAAFRRYLEMALEP